MQRKTTPAQAEASRRNGAQSRGPVTARGKAISARNRYTHGMLSRTIIIEGEDPRRFSALLGALREEFQPVGELEESIVEELAICRWRQRRLLAMETACLSNEIRGQSAVGEPETHPERAVRAFKDISSQTRVLDLINRAELRFGRQFNRSLQHLLAMRTAENSKNAGSNLGSD